MPEVIWKRGAEEDLVRVFAEFEERREGKGEAFTRTLDEILACVRRHPQMAPYFESPMRRLVVSNSGYGIFYTVEARGIIIHALVHLSQNPDSIRARIRRLLDLS